MKKKFLEKISIIKKKFKDKKIYLHEPSILKDDITSVLKALKEKEVSTYGKYTRIFESKISQFIKNNNVISVINTKDIEEKVSTYVVAGNNAEIFMSQNNLYLTSYMYQNNDFSCPR